MAKIIAEWSGNAHLETLAVGPELGAEEKGADK
jgi:hypothetical protein